jgi:hypothetical protein
VITAAEEHGKGDSLLALLVLHRIDGLVVFPAKVVGVPQESAQQAATVRNKPQQSATVRNKAQQGETRRNKALLRLGFGIWGLGFGV